MNPESQPNSPEPRDLSVPARPTPSLGGRVIQPIHDNIVPDALPPRPQPAPAPSPTTPTQAAPNLSQTNLAPSAQPAGQPSIRTINSVQPATPQTEQSKSEIVPIVIAILGLWTVLSAVISIPSIVGIIGMGITSNPSNHISGLHMIIEFCSLGLSILLIFIGIGLLRRKNFARSAYIFLSCIGIIITIGSYYGSTQDDINTLVANQAANAPTSSSLTLSGSTDTAQNTHYDAAAQQKEQQAQATYRKSLSEASMRTIPSYILSIIFTIVVIVFLTRPSVKKLFH